MNTATEPHLIEQLTKSEIYRDYERAFSEATGLPLALRPVENWKLAHHGKHHENPFCAMLAKCSQTCAACLETQQRNCDAASHEPRTTVCFAGLSESSVPICVGEKLLGFLQTGEVVVGKASKRQFTRTARQLTAWGAKVDLRRLEEAYFHTKVLAPKSYESVLRLLTIFGQHLGLVANQLALRTTNAEPPTVAKARQFIGEHHEDDLALADVARVVNMSTFYFCKTFKKATGMTFTDYLSRVRIEKARELLLNPNARVSEVAFAVGFQSLTHFNRVFRRLLGQSPTAWRAALPR
jgi:AraC-like DNA-binding protein/ligand-binding sensor protein